MKWEAFKVDKNDVIAPFIKDDLCIVFFKRNKPDDIPPRIRIVATDYRYDNEIEFIVELE